MSTWMFKYAFEMLLVVLKQKLTDTELRGAIDAGCDAIEDYVDKDTKLDVADPALAFATKTIRRITNTPDDD